MLVYIVLLIVLCLYSAKPRSAAGLFVSFILLFVVEAFRDYSVGTDTLNYISKYNADIINSVSGTVKGLEFGWTALVRVNAAIFDIPDRPLLIETTLLFLVPIYVVAAKYNRRRAGLIILYAFLLYFYFNSFNTIRQSIAMAWCLWAYCEFVKGERWKAAIILFVAVSIHTTALLMISLPFISRMRIKLIWALAVLGVTFVIGSFNLISPLVSLIAGNEIYALYADAFLQGGTSFSPTRLALNALVIYLLVKTKGNNPMWIFMLVGVALLNLFASLPYVARIAQYFLFFQILLFPRLESRNARFITCVYAFCTFGFLLFSNVGEIVPYSFG